MTNKMLGHNSYFHNHSCCKNGFAMGSMPSTGQTNTTAVPRHTARPICLVSSVSLNGSSGSARNREHPEMLVRNHIREMFHSKSM